MDNYILMMQTFPASRIELGSGLVRFRKELIRVGKYVKESTGQKINVTLDLLKHWVNEYNRWIAGGNKCPIPLGHERENQPEFNRGWVTSLFVEGNSLYGLLDLSDESLALTTDVSIAVPNKITDGKGVEYNQPIVHVALTTMPVVGGLEGFTKLSLNLGVPVMNEFLKKIAAKLKLSKVDPTEDDILAAIKVEEVDLSKVAVALKLSEDATEEEILAAIKPVEAIKPEKVELSVPVAPAPQVVKLVAENREIKLSGLVKAGIITPAVKDVIAARYTADKAVSLELSKGDDSGFDFVYNILAQNNPVALAEITGVQVPSLELSNKSKDEPENATLKDVNRRRKAAGLKD